MERVVGIHYWQAGLPRDWKLGLGPCGETVTQLGVHVGQYDLHIRQTTAEGGVRDFIIPRSDLGNITITTKEAEHVAA
jgi:hypothetical protein